jgi:hypothetical protein
VNKIEFLHPRFNASTLEEIPQEWGNVQIDGLSYVLQGIADGWKAGLAISGAHITARTLISILQSIEYWSCEDNGIWEENIELHASSVGACIGALKSISEFIEVPSLLIENGESALSSLLPRESASKHTDLALATITCFPFNVVDGSEIMWDMTRELERSNGGIRYSGDAYYAEGSEMEWPLWFAYAGIYYANIGAYTTAHSYLGRLKMLYDANWRKGIPEGYVNGVANANNPLGWTCALMVNLIDLLYDKNGNKLAC